MEEFATMASIPLIVTFVYFVVSLYKTVISGKAEIYTRLIPVIAAGVGMAIGVISFYVAPTVVMANNVILAALQGGVSGLAATGTHQLIKQLNVTEPVDDSLQSKDDKTD